ncbi:MAG: ABC transporter ATP-binding protein [Candidimonas sp.]|nr:MAG: ABC transporter ATP-binding protein [Candidimonas sp.]
MSADLLLARDIETGYGKIQALWGLSLSVRSGETVVLIGPNGAGKTTLIKTLMGLLRLWRGEVTFADKSITHERADRRVRAGMAYMSEIGCFPDLTVQDNLLIGAQFLSRSEAKRHLAALYARFPTLEQKRKALGGSLSGGQRKILGVAKALAGKPRLLVMDEPSAGLSPLFVKEVIQALRQFHDTGLSLFIAEQNVKFLDIADRVYTLEGGRVGFAGTVAQLHANAALERTYFGLRRNVADA